MPQWYLILDGPDGGRWVGPFIDADAAADHRSDYGPPRAQVTEVTGPIPTDVVVQSPLAFIESQKLAA